MQSSMRDTEKLRTYYPGKAWRIAVTANVNGISAGADEPADAYKDCYEKPETIHAVLEILNTEGHQAAFIPGGPNLPAGLLEMKPDIIFNLAEGLTGEGREAQAPALYEMLGIPYTGSRIVAHAISLDKTLTKRVWRDHGLPTAAFQEFTDPRQPLDNSLEFPLFVKPAREGTSMGISASSIVQDEAEMRSRVEWVIGRYQQPALVEEYLSGREFTMPVLGRPDARQHSPHPEIYGDDGFFHFLVQEIDTSGSATPGVYSLQLKELDYDEPGSAQFIIPAVIDNDLANELHELSIRAHQAIGALDVSRIDIRLDRYGKPSLIEINTLPGIVPGFSDLYTIADRSGLKYRQLILEILYLGASRFGLI